MERGGKPQGYIDSFKRGNTSGLGGSNTDHRKIKAFARKVVEQEPQLEMDTVIRVYFGILRYVIANMREKEWVELPSILKMYACKQRLRKSWEITNPYYGHKVHRFAGTYHVIRFKPIQRFKKYFRAFFKDKYKEDIDNGNGA